MPIILFGIITSRKGNDHGYIFFTLFDRLIYTIYTHTTVWKIIPIKSYKLRLSQYKMQNFSGNIASSRHNISKTISQPYWFLYAILTGISWKFYGRYVDLTKQYEVPLSRMLHDILEDNHTQWHPPLIRHYTNFWPFTDLDLITEFDFLPNCVRFPYNICNGCGMPTEDAYSSGHLVLSHFWTCMCSNVETNLSWTCLASGLFGFEHPSIRLFCSLECHGGVKNSKSIVFLICDKPNIYTATRLWKFAFSLGKIVNTNQISSSSKGIKMIIYWHKISDKRGRKITYKTGNMPTLMPTTNKTELQRYYFLVSYF